MRIAVFGGHSSGLIVAETIATSAQRGETIALAGFLNDTRSPGDRIGDYPVLGRFDDWSTIDAEMRFIAAFPFPTEMAKRHGRLRALSVPDDRWQTVCHPGAHIARSALLGPGCYVAAGVVVEPGATVGAHTILRAGAYVSHDVTIGEFAFVGPRATLLGRTRVGAGVHIGANAVCREGSTLHDYALIGIGSVIVRDVEPGAVVAGNPARPLRAVRSNGGRA
jgi:sugar O-acyltransferase (sialic acid O-acetyltransferase NeuD family)